MSIAMVCTAHSPIMACYARKPDAFDEIENAFDAQAEAVRAFNPELVIVFGADHFNGFFLSLVPPFCAGLSCEAVDDIGGFPGILNVPSETATDLIDAVRVDGVDIACAHEMKIDHGFTQPMQRILGGLDRYPTIPIFVNGIMPPFIPFQRSRLLGEAIGKFAAQTGKRVLIMGSGGMSHNPQRYYPAIGDGTDEVAGYQMEGGQDHTNGAGLTHQQWLDRLEVMHLEGAKMLIDGRRTREDIFLNPEFDNKFLDIATSGDLTQFDGWNPEETVAVAGIGSLELNTWIAACAANQAAGGSLPKTAVYADTLEYGIGFGLIHAGATA
jgi:2,3-dihydroxyphenylpropionate 1,2-dioxygenase